MSTKVSNTLKVLLDIKGELVRFNGEMVSLKGEVVTLSDRVESGFTDLGSRFERFVTGPGLHHDTHQRIEARLDRIEKRLDLK